MVIEEIFVNASSRKSLAAFSVMSPCLPPYTTEKKLYSNVVDDALDHATTMSAICIRPRQELRI